MFHWSITASNYGIKANFVLSRIRANAVAHARVCERSTERRSRIIIALTAQPFNHSIIKHSQKHIFFLFCSWMSRLHSRCRIPKLLIHTVSWAQPLRMCSVSIELLIVFFFLILIRHRDARWTRMTHFLMHNPHSARSLAIRVRFVSQLFLHSTRLYSQPFATRAASVSQKQANNVEYVTVTVKIQSFI